jgi:hypothetical protein
MDDDNIWDDDDVAPEAGPSHFAKLKGHLSNMQFNLNASGGSGPRYASADTRKLLSQLSRETGTPPIVRAVDSGLRNMGYGFKRAEGLYKSPKLGLNYGKGYNPFKSKVEIPGEEGQGQLGAGAAAPEGLPPSSPSGGMTAAAGRGTEKAETVHQGEFIQDVVKAPGSSIYGHQNVSRTPYRKPLGP